MKKDTLKIAVITQEGKMFSLSGRTAVITGATGAIGSAIVHAMHKCGAYIIALGTKQSALESLQDQLQERCSTFICNLPENASTIISRIEEKHPVIDILVNNAGITKDTLSMKMKESEWDDVLNINLKSVFQLSQQAIKNMMKQRRGRILNISSVIAVTGNAGQANYAASKAGMIGMSKSIAQEVASRNITVNCIAPGFIHSPMSHAIPEELQQKLLTQIPLRRIGTPEEVASCAVFLASDEASYITGSVLHVNGGLAMI